jgi:hypothetical protein
VSHGNPFIIQGRELSKNHWGENREQQSKNYQRNRQFHVQNLFMFGVERFPFYSVLDLVIGNLAGGPNGEDGVKVNLAGSFPKSK